MALKLAVAAGEQIVDSVEVPGGWWSNSWRFGFAVTREALYVPTKKRGGLVLWEPLEQRRIPVSLVHVVRLREAGVERFQFWATAVMVFVALGFLLLSIFGIAGWERRNGGMFVFLAAIGGLWLYGSGGRYEIVVETSDLQSSFVPEPSRMRSRKVKKAALEVQERFLAACAAAGIRTSDERAPAA